MVMPIVTLVQVIMCVVYLMNNGSAGHEEHSLSHCMVEEMEH